MNTNNHFSISIIEPTWNNRIHLPANLGLLRIVREAFPTAVINFVGGSEQIKNIINEAPSNIQDHVNFHAWLTGEDSDTLPTDIYKTLKKLRALPKSVTTDASHIFFSSCTASTLAATAILGIASKSLAILHGNANDLIGWRSRNPFRRALDLYGAMKWFCRRGGRAVVLEEVIQSKLSERLPWISKKIVCLPHPITPEESAKEAKPCGQPIRIAFAGNASIAKGFPEFLELAAALHHQRPGQFEFHAFGYLPDESRLFDQSVLFTKAKKSTLERNKYVEKLTDMDFIFAWHSDRYYGLAASGIVYDAVNFLVPLIAKQTGQTAEWEKRGLKIGFMFEAIHSAIKFFVETDHGFIEKKHAAFCEDIGVVRSTLTISSLAANMIKKI